MTIHKGVSRRVSKTAADGARTLPGRRTAWALAGLLALAGAGQGSAAAQPASGPSAGAGRTLADMAGMSPAELLDRGAKASGPQEQRMFWGVLAVRHPATPQGRLAAAWVADYDGEDRQKAASAYQQAVEAAPDSFDALYNWAFVLNEAGRFEESLSAYQRAIALRPDHRKARNNAYFLILDNLKDEARARAYLASMAQDKTAPVWMADAIRGVQLHVAGRHDESEKLLVKAARAGGTSDFELVERLYQVRLDQWRQNNLETSERLRRLAVMPDDVAPADRYLALRFIGTQAMQLKAYEQGYRWLYASYELRPSIEAALTAYENTYFLPDASAVLPWLERAAQRFPGSTRLHDALSHSNYTVAYEPSKVEAQSRAALDRAVFQDDIVRAVNTLADFYQTAGRFADTRALYDGFLDPKGEGRRLSERSRRTLREVFVVKLLEGRDLGRARQEIAVLAKEAGDDANRRQWLMQRQLQADTLAATLQAGQDYYARHPFLRQWERDFGVSMSLAVEFETGSDAILPASHGLLDKAAAALKSSGAEQYIFQIEGHTDSRGSDAVNQPLSERRAQSVARYLSSRHGIDAARLRTVGHSARHALAPNTDAAGWQRNRRVEIRPYGNVAEPQVAIQGVLDSANMVLSADGRLAATGFDTLQLWDMRTGTKVHDLYRGGGMRAFSPNGRYLAALSDYKEVWGGMSSALYVYDTRTGLLVDYLPALGEGQPAYQSLSWSPYSDAIALVDAKGYLRVYDIAGKSVRHVARAGDRHIGGSVTWLPDGQHIVTGLAQMSYLTVWKAADLTPLRRLDGVSWTHALDASGDGRYLMAADNRRKLSVWRTKDWTLRHTIDVPVIPAATARHPAKPWVAMNNKFTNGDPASAELLVVDLDAGRAVARRSGAGRPGMGFTPDGARLVASASGRFVQYDTAAAALPEVATTSLPDPVAIGVPLAVDQEQALLLSSDAEGTSVWDLTTGRRVHRLQSGGVWLPLDEGGTRYVSTAGSPARLAVFDTRDFRETLIDSVPIGADVREVKVVDGHVLLLHVSQGAGARQAKGTIEVRRAAEGFPLVGRVTADLVTEPLRYGRLLDAGIGGVAIDAAGGQLAMISYWQDGVGRPRTYSSQLRVFGLADGKPRGTIALNGQISDVAFVAAAGGGAWRLKTGAVWSTYAASDRRYVSRESALPYFEHALADGRKVVWSRSVLRLGERQVVFPETLRSVASHPGRRLLLAQTYANEIHFYDLDSLERKLTLVPRHDGEWLAHAPTGEFTASMHGTKGAYWSLGDNTLPFDALRSRYERPQLIQGILARVAEGGGGGGRPEPVKPPAPIAPVVFQAPYKVSLVSPASADTEAQDYQLRLQVEKQDAALPDPVFEYRLNGRPVSRSRGFEEEPFVADDKEMIGVSRRFMLQEGENLIEASLVYQDARLQTQTVRVVRRVPAPPAQATVRPTTQMWYFGVGISTYERPAQNLEFAHKDALALEAEFKRHEGTLYGKVNTLVLTDDKADEKSIRIGMNDFLRQASAEDVIVIFVAGHGVQDNEQRLFLATHEADVQRPYTGMEVSKFRDFLDARPINQKAVFLMDICHAGTAGPRRRGRITAEDAVQALAEGTGTIVVASSTGAQSSLEDASFGGGHGAFTAALLEGLKGKADADAGDGNGYVSIQELISYASRRVPQMTQGAQHPTVPRMDNVRDFPLGRVGG